MEVLGKHFHDCIFEVSRLELITLVICRDS